MSFESSGFQNNVEDGKKPSLESKEHIPSPGLLNEYVELVWGNVDRLKDFSEKNSVEQAFLAADVFRKEIVPFELFVDVLVSEIPDSETLGREFKASADQSVVSEVDGIVDDFNAWRQEILQERKKTGSSIKLTPEECGKALVFLGKVRSAIVR
jgi:hypothetical protein